MDLMKKYVFFLMLIVFVSTYAEKKVEKEVAVVLARTNNIPDDSVENTTDSYFEGYIQAMIDMHYYEYRVIVVVKDEQVWLANLPKNKMLTNSITGFVQDIPGVKCVKIVNEVCPDELKHRKELKDRPRIRGIWFPQTTELYLPMIAYPRQVLYSAGYRGGDRVCGNFCATFSLGDNFPIYRWLGVLPWCGDLQIGIESGMWSVFNMDPHPNVCGGSEMVNSDFYVAIPIAYAVNEWAFRFRIYHISSHLGDEFLVNHPQFINCDGSPKEVRVNPSMEVVDFFTSYQANRDLRVYGGVGYIFHSDETFPLEPWYVEGGGEYNFWGHKYHAQKLYGNFFVAVYFRLWEALGFPIDQSYMLGYEWSKIQGVGRKIRIVGEYRDGFSLEGQFMTCRVKYGAVRLIYGF